MQVSAEDDDDWSVVGTPGKYGDAAVGYSNPAADFDCDDNKPPVQSTTF